MQKIFVRLTITMMIMTTVACDQSAPEKVCAAEDTVASVRSLALKTLVGDPSGIDMQRMQRAFDDEVELDLIQFDDFEEEPSITRCRARLSVAGGSTTGEITYTRQPVLGSRDFVYRVELLEPGAWRAISLAVIRRYRSLQAEGSRAEAERRLPAPSEEGPEESLPQQPEPPQTPDARRFALRVLEIEPDSERDRLFVTYRNDRASNVADATIVCRLLDMTNAAFAEGKAPAEPLSSRSTSTPNVVRLSGDFERVDVRTRTQCRVELGGQHSDWKTGWTYGPRS